MTKEINKCEDMPKHVFWGCEECGSVLSWTNPSSSTPNLQCYHGNHINIMTPLVPQKQDLTSDA